MTHLRTPFNNLSRRDFLRLAALGAGSLALRPMAAAPGAPSAASQAGSSFAPPALPFFPEAERLGRVAVGMVELKAAPDPNSATSGVLYEDAVLPWLSERTGAMPAYIFNNQRWVETPQGYLYGPYFQPVFNRPNSPVSELRQTSIGPGMWAEVTVPYAEAALVQREPSSNSWAEAKVDQGVPLRVYYGQLFWIDTIRTDDQGRTFYRINPNYYGGVDMLWVDAQALRPIGEDELAPISPEVTDKRIEVDVTHQTLSCFENGGEVYHCRVSTGAKFDMYGNVVDAWSTPVGEHVVHAQVHLVADERRDDRGGL